MLFCRKSRPDTRVVRWTGFTLTELMIVVAIIGLLAAIAMPTFVKARDNSRLNAIYHNLREIDSAKDQWALEQKKTEGTVVGDISELSQYLRGGGVNDVLREDYIPNPVGTPPQASLPSGVGLGPYAPGSSIPAP
jgi:prepilin-type N-terminal cleavage/methylation domain-containing protein